MTSTPLAPGVTPVYGEPVTEEKLQEIVVRIVEQFDPEQIILFGSYAYGDPTPDSDVDLLVIMDSDLPMVERMGAVSRVLPRPLFPLDLLAYTPEEIETQRGRFDPFLKEVLEKGRLLYERPDVAGEAWRWEEDECCMDDPFDDLMAWVGKAEQDYQGAYGMMQLQTGPIPDLACFLAQQCVEKYLKALLTRHRVFFPKTHDLVEINALCQQVRPDLQLKVEDLRWLSDFAVLARYPRTNATHADAERALAIMDAARAQLRAEMGLDT